MNDCGIPYLSHLDLPSHWERVWGEEGYGSSGEGITHSITFQEGEGKSLPPLPLGGATQPSNFIPQRPGIFFLFVLKITDTISKTQMPSVEGTAENTWVPPEGQHQGLHGPPTSPTLEQLGAWTAGSSLGLTPSSCLHLGRRWGRGLTPPINKCSPNPQ